jgi:hypothetical protein
MAGCASGACVDAQPQHGSGPSWIAGSSLGRSYCVVDDVVFSQATSPASGCLEIVKHILQLGPDVGMYLSHQCLSDSHPFGQAT